MAAPIKKYRSRRQIAALNFLSNISLDGTHRDTHYNIFNQRGLNFDVDKECDRSSHEQCPDASPQCSNLTVTVENVQPQASSLTVDKRDVTASLSAGNLPSCSTRERRYTSSGSEPDAEKRELDFYADHNSELSYSTKPHGISTIHKGNLQEGEFRKHSSKRTRHRSCSTERASGRRRLFSRTKSISEDEGADSVFVEPAATGLFHRKRLTSASSSASSLTSSGAVTLSHDARSLCAQTVRRRLGAKSARVVLVTSPGKVPFSVFSTLPYSKANLQPLHRQDTEATRGKHLPGHSRDAADVIPGIENVLCLEAIRNNRLEDGQDVSYSRLLIPSKQRMPQVDTKVSTETKRRALSRRSSVADEGRPRKQLTAQRYSLDLEFDLGMHMTYDPNQLDDPELRSGKHRTLMTFSSYMTSVIDYVKPSDLKRELNDKFRERFPYIQLTLSKLRSLKRVMCRIILNKCHLDAWVAAASVVYFEKVISKGLINKSNRRLIACACCMLSAKLNDTRSSDVKKLCAELEDTFKLHRKDMLAFEIGVLVALEFGLHVSDFEVFPHYQRLIYMS